MFLQPNAARTETFEYGGFAAVEKRLRNEWVHRRMKALFPECSRFVLPKQCSPMIGSAPLRLRSSVDRAKLVGLLLMGLSTTPNAVWTEEQPPFLHYEIVGDAIRLL